MHNLIYSLKVFLLISYFFFIVFVRLALVLAASYVGCYAVVSLDMKVCRQLVKAIMVTHAH